MAPFTLFARKGIDGFVLRIHALVSQHQSPRDCRYNLDTLFRTSDFAGKAPNTILRICGYGFLFFFIPAKDVDETSVDARLTTGADV